MRWTVVHQAADSQTASQHALSALSELCQIYWRPVYVFLRRQGIAQHDAQDLTQGFFADLIDSRAYTRVDPTKGSASLLLARNSQTFRDESSRHGRLGWRFQRLISSRTTTAPSLMSSFSS
jgi:RNA polymerase sigma-70 factor (ECF subfamily)